MILAIVVLYISGFFLAYVALETTPPSNVPSSLLGAVVWPLIGAMCLFAVLAPASWLRAYLLSRGETK